MGLSHRCQSKSGAAAPPLILPVFLLSRYIFSDIQRNCNKDEERYAKEAGKLMLFLAAGSLIMTVLLYFQVIAAVVQIVVWIIVFGILWKKMDERYGA